MSSTQSLVALIKAELKTQGLCYAGLAEALGLSESSVKRMLAPGGEMPLSRVDEICRVLKLEFAELAARMAAQPPAQRELSLEQEKAVVADPKLLLVAICCLSHWSFEQILANYRLTEAQAIQALTRLDAVGVIELRPLNRYRLLVSKGFRWQPDGPVMRYFRSQVVGEYFSGGFDGEGELLMLVHGQIARGPAALFNERLQRVAQDFAQQHLADQRLPDSQREAYTLLIGMRSWQFAAFVDLRREAPA